MTIKQRTWAVASVKRSVKNKTNMADIVQAIVAANVPQGMAITVRQFTQVRIAAGHVANNNRVINALFHAASVQTSRRSQ